MRSAGTRQSAVTCPQQQPTPQCPASLQAGAVCRARLAYESARVVVDGCGLEQDVAALEICAPRAAELHAKRLLACASNKGVAARQSVRRQSEVVHAVPARTRMQHAQGVQVVHAVGDVDQAAADGDLRGPRSARIGRAAFGCPAQTWSGRRQASDARPASTRARAHERAVLRGARGAHHVGRAVRVLKAAR